MPLPVKKGCNTVAHFTLFCLLALPLSGCSPYAALKGRDAAKDRFIPLPLNEVLAEHESLILAPKKSIINLNPRAEDRPYRITMAYLGPSRLITEKRWDTVQIWGRLFKVPVDFTRQYTREVKLKAGQTELWLPVRESDLERMKTVLSQGEFFEVWTMVIGSVREADRLSYLLIVNSFKELRNRP